MIILSNGLTPRADEGALQVATSLIRRIKKLRPETMVITYEREAPESDLHLPLNKLLLDGRLIRQIREKQEPVLYVPFPARMLPTAVRIFLLSRYARWGLKTLLVMNGETNRLARRLLKISGSEILTLSRQSYDRLRAAAGSRTVYLKTGVDTEKFSPALPRQKAALREKYGIPQDKQVVLHVGHLAAGRNIGTLLSLGENWHIVLAVSTLTASVRDEALRQQFLQKSNVTLLEDYLPDIQELYQLSDVYLFPVAEAGHCIDVPLSALEAAACGIPVVATEYGELKELTDKTGFYKIESFEPERLDALLHRAAAEGTSPRETVLEYDWKRSAEYLLL